MIDSRMLPVWLVYCIHNTCLTALSDTCARCTDPATKWRPFITVVLWIFFSINIILCVSRYCWIEDINFAVAFVGQGRLFSTCWSVVIFFPACLFKALTIQRLSSYLLSDTSVDSVFFDRINFMHLQTKKCWFDYCNARFTYKSHWTARSWMNEFIEINRKSVAMRYDELACL